MKWNEIENGMYLLWMLNVYCIALDSRLGRYGNRLTPLTILHTTILICEPLFIWFQVKIFAIVEFLSFIALLSESIPEAGIRFIAKTKSLNWNNWNNWLLSSSEQPSTTQWCHSIVNCLLKMNCLVRVQSQMRVYFILLNGITVKRAFLLFPCLYLQGPSIALRNIKNDMSSTKSLAHPLIRSPNPFSAMLVIICDRRIVRVSQR